MKAEVSGANLKDPGRFKDRKVPKGTRPLGGPYKNMTKSQIENWEEFKSDLPWLNSSHRQILRLACVLTDRVSDPDCSVQAIQALSAVLSKLGATPTDETKINYDPGEEDPDGQFFGRPH